MCARKLEAHSPGLDLLSVPADLADTPIELSSLDSRFHTDLISSGRTARVDSFVTLEGHPGAGEVPPESGQAPDVNATLSRDWAEGTLERMQL